MSTLEGIRPRALSHKNSSFLSKFLNSSAIKSVAEMQSASFVGERRSYAMSTLLKLVREEEGQSLVEYGLILGLVSVALIAVLGTMRAELSKIFESVAKSLKTASASVKTTK